MDKQNLPKDPILKPIEPKKNSEKIVGLIFVIVLLLVASVYLVFTNMKLQKEIDSMKIVGGTNSPKAVATTDPTAGWKTVRDGLNTYMFKVPQDWIEIEHSSNFQYELVFQSSDGLMKVSANAVDNLNASTGKPYNTLDEFIGLSYTVKSLAVDGQDARQPLPRAGSENIDKVYFFSKDSKLILSVELQVGNSSVSDSRVTQESIQQGSQLFSQILSTFKFTDQTSEMSNWKTYTNNTYHISFQYPSGLTPDVQDNGKMLTAGFSNGSGKQLIVWNADTRANLTDQHGFTCIKSLSTNVSVKVGSYDAILNSSETDNSGGDCANNTVIYDIYFASVKDKPLDIQYDGPKDQVSQTELNQILNSFKFTQ